MWRCAHHIASTSILCVVKACRPHQEYLGILQESSESGAAWGCLHQVCHTMHSTTAQCVCSQAVCAGPACVGVRDQRTAQQGVSGRVRRTARQSLPASEGRGRTRPGRARPRSPPQRPPQRTTTCGWVPGDPHSAFSQHGFLPQARTLCRAALSGTYSAAKSLCTVYAMRRPAPLRACSRLDSALVASNIQPKHISARLGGSWM
jgi:hypothetical protein